MMRYDATPAVYLIKLFDVLRQQEGRLDALLRHLGGAESDFIHRDQPIPLATYISAVEFACAEFDQPDLGFLVGEHTEFLEHGVVGYALLSSPNLRESLHRYVRYQYLQGPLLSIRLDIDSALASMTATPRRGRWRFSASAFHYFVQEWLVSWNKWSAYIGKRGSFFEHVRLSYSATGNWKFYEDHLGCTVSFDNAETTAIIPARWLDRPLEFADNAIAALCSAQCERLMQILDTQSGLKADIHRLLTSSPGETVKMDAVARKLNMGTRTLRRRLRQEGTSFQEVVVEFRVAMAKRYLQETDLPANEIAALVGYSDPANLYRVFLGATGRTPSGYRTHKAGKQVRLT